MINEKFLQHLAMLESVAPAADRETINMVRGKYVQFALMEADEAPAEQPAEKTAEAPAVDADVMKTIEKWCEGKDIKTIKQLVAKVDQLPRKYRQREIENQYAADKDAAKNQAFIGKEKLNAAKTQAANSTAINANGATAQKQQQVDDANKARADNLAQIKEAMVGSMKEFAPSITPDKISDQAAEKYVKQFGVKANQGATVGQKAGVALAHGKETAQNLAGAAKTAAAGIGNKAAGAAKGWLAKLKRGAGTLANKFMNEAIERGDYETVRRLKNMNPKQFICYCESIGYDMSEYRSIFD